MYIFLYISIYISIYIILANYNYSYKCYKTYTFSMNCPATPEVLRTTAPCANGPTAASCCGASRGSKGCSACRTRPGGILVLGRTAISLWIL